MDSFLVLLLRHCRSEACVNTELSRNLQSARQSGGVLRGDGMRGSRRRDRRAGYGTSRGAMSLSVSGSGLLKGSA
jgi:hypothetical protein